MLFTLCTDFCFFAIATNIKDKSQFIEIVSKQIYNCTRVFETSSFKDLQVIYSGQLIHNILSIVPKSKEVLKSSFYYLMMMMLLPILNALKLIIHHHSYP
jgi:hypothetical protein